MKSIKLVIPRMLIIGFYQHPEPYGEFIVELENGMTTDVYKENDGSLYTLTNNDELISYVNNKVIETTIFKVRENDILMRSAEKKDVKIIIEYYKNNIDNFKDDIEFDELDSYLYINKYKTEKSDTLVIGLKNEISAIIQFNYSRKYKNMFFDLYIMNNVELNPIEVDSILNMFIRHVQSLYSIETIFTEVYEKDNLMINTLIRNKFSKENKKTNRKSFNGLDYYGIIFERKL